MKKRTSIRVLSMALLIVLSVFCLAGCGSEKGKSEEKKKDIIFNENLIGTWVLKSESDSDKTSFTFTEDKVTFHSENKNGKVLYENGKWLLHQENLEISFENYSDGKIVKIVQSYKNDELVLKPESDEDKIFSGTFIKEKADDGKDKKVGEDKAKKEETKEEKAEGTNESKASPEIEQKQQATKTTYDNLLKQFNATSRYVIYDVDRDGVDDIIIQLGEKYGEKSLSYYTISDEDYSKCDGFTADSFDVNDSEFFKDSDGNLYIQTKLLNNYCLIKLVVENNELNFETIGEVHVEDQDTDESIEKRIKEMQKSTGHGNFEKVEWVSNPYYCGY